VNFCLQLRRLAVLLALRETLLFLRPSLYLLFKCKVLALSLTRAHTLSLSHADTHPLSLSLSHTHTHPHTQSLSWRVWRHRCFEGCLSAYSSNARWWLSLSHTRTLSLTHTHTHTQLPLCPSLALSLFRSVSRSRSRSRSLALSRSLTLTHAHACSPSRTLALARAPSPSSSPSPLPRTFSHIHTRKKISKHTSTDGRSVFDRIHTLLSLSDLICTLLSLSLYTYTYITRTVPPKIQISRRTGTSGRFACSCLLPCGKNIGANWWRILPCLSRPMASRLLAT